MNNKIENAKLTYAKNVTIDDVVEEADQIYNLLKSRKLDKRDTAGHDAFFKEMLEMHKDFATSYPIVLKYLCQLHLYDSGVLRRHIKKISETPPRSESDYLDSLTDYVVMLYKRFAAHWDRKSAAALWKSLRDQLQAETDQYKDIVKKYQEEQKSRDATNDAANKQDFAQFFKENEEFFMNDGNIPIVAKSDLAPTDAAALALEREMERARLEDSSDSDADLSLYID